MLTILVGAVVLAVVTAVHEGGHWLAVRAKGGRVLRVRVGRGPALWRRKGAGPEIVIAPFPFGGRIDYEGVPSGTAQVVVAVSGSAANLLFALVGFGCVRSLARTDGVPGGAADGPVGYALRVAGGWFWTVPEAVRDLVATGMAQNLSRSIRDAIELLATADPLSVLYVASAVSAVWAAVNLIPVPLIRTDGWLALTALWEMGSSRRWGSRPPPS